MARFAGLIALVLLVTGCDLGGDEGRSGVRSASMTSASVVYRDPSRTWEITHPKRFHRGPIPQLPGAPRITYEGVWTANFDSPDFDVGAIPSHVPEDGVFVEVSQRFGGPPYVPQESDSELPISYADLKVQRNFDTGEWRTASVVANGDPYTIAARIGKEASVEDRQAAIDIVSSLRFFPLRSGSTTGRQLTYFVLDRPDAYPIGSVSRFDSSNLPDTEWRDPRFYLVHTRDGFYALSWEDDLQGGYKDCDVSYEPASREFSCSNGARWDLDGSVIAKPEAGLPDDPLGVKLVRISLDDRVLVGLNVTMSSTSLDLQLTGAG